MADSPNVSVVRRLYQARGNPEVIRQVLGSDVRWEGVDGFPYGAIYEGHDSVMRDFFGRLFRDSDESVETGCACVESHERVRALASHASRLEVHRAFRAGVGIAERVDRALAALCRYRAARSRPGRLERDLPLSTLLRRAVSRCRPTAHEVAGSRSR